MGYYLGFPFGFAAALIGMWISNKLNRVGRSSR